ncbi:MAG: glycosyltransferase [Caldilineales bacterium]|nr:glycosyltransferase [Caldilineales bacterium]
MLSGHAIACFSANPWDALWRNRQQIMSRLACHNRILFIEPAPYLSETTAALRHHPLATLRRSHLTSPLPNLWVYTPAVFAPRSGRPPLSHLTFALRRRDLRQTLRRLDMARPLLWLFRYDLGEMVGQLDERLAIYHAVDEYSAYALGSEQIEGRDRRQIIRQLEADLIRRVDLVFVTSPALLESKSPLHPHVVLVPNGVDVEHFARPAASVPPDIANLPRPLIGYAGVLNEKIDFDLLAAVAGQHPAWTFALVGPNALRNPDELRPLRQLGNVHLLGGKAVEALPAYVQRFDAALMPYRRNEWTRNISPLKLYEYLAAGIPIVSTSIPAIEPFAGVLWQADDAAGFAQALAAALAADSPDRRRRQQALAQAHSWDQRLEALSTAIQERLAATNTQHATRNTQPLNQP